MATLLSHFKILYKVKVSSDIAVTTVLLRTSCATLEVIALSDFVYTC